MCSWVDWPLTSLHANTVDPRMGPTVLPRAPRDCPMPLTVPRVSVCKRVGEDKVHLQCAGEHQQSEIVGGWVHLRRSFWLTVHMQCHTRSWTEAARTYFVAAHCCQDLRKLCLCYYITYICTLNIESSVHNFTHCTWYFKGKIPLQHHQRTNCVVLQRGF